MALVNRCRPASGSARTFVAKAARGGADRCCLGTNKYEVPELDARLSPVLPALQAAGSDTLTAIAVLVVAIAVAGIAILFLFAKKKI